MATLGISGELRTLAHGHCRWLALVLVVSAATWLNDDRGIERLARSPEPIPTMYRSGWEDHGEQDDDGKDDDGQDEVPETIDELVERLEQVLEDHAVPGVGVALVDRSGVIWAGGAGVADRRRGAAVDAGTVFRVGSISKTIIALAVMTLVEDGRLSLDTPIVRLAPDIAFKNRWSESDPITVAHLLEHTAGFDDMRFNEMFVDPDGDEDGDEDGAASEPTLREALAKNPRSRTSRWRPGSRHAYSNPGYTVVAHIIERITGMPFERYVEERVLRPAGMATAGFSLTEELRVRLAQGYDGLRNQRSRPLRRLLHRPAGELLSSPEELAGLVQVLLARGRTDRGALVSEASLARMERGLTRDFPDLPGGYGLGLYGDMSLPVFGRGHNGGLPGFVSELRYFDELGLGYVLLFNATGGDIASAYSEIRTLLFRFLTRDRELPEPPEVEVPEDELAAYVGSYEFSSPRFALWAFVDRVRYSANVSLRAGKLFLRLGNGAGATLIATGDDRFRTRWDSGPILQFGRAPDGTRILAIGDAYFEQGDGKYIERRRLVLGAAVWLTDVGFFWNVIWLPGWLILVVRFRRRFPLPRDAAPALACACFVLMNKLLAVGADAGALGHPGFYSLTFLAASLAFPVLSVLALVGAVRGLRRDIILDAELDELVEISGFITQIYSDDWRHRLYQLAAGAACVVLSGYLTYHGIIGLRTWAW